MKNKFILGLLVIPMLLLAACSDDGEETAPVEVSPIVGTWKLQPVAGALAVGPTAGSADWWFNTTDDVGTRACLFDDTYTFSEDGSFTIAQGSETWLEEFQGGSSAGNCGTPVAPHAGGSFTYEFNETAGTLALNGTGAFVGLAKVNNQGELPAVAVPSSITYSVAEFTGEGSTRKMKLIVEAGSGVFWTFLLQVQ